MLKDLKKSGDGTPVVYAQEVKLETGKNCLRLVDPDNEVSFWESWIMCDDGTKRSFIVNNSFTGSNILGKIIGDVKFFNRGGILEKVRGEDGKQKYKIDSVEDPEIIDAVRYNSDSLTDKSGWGPKQKFIFNVIDRKDSWCKDNKKTKVLKIGRKLGEKFVVLEESTGPMDQFDINIEKAGSGITGTTYDPTVPTSFVQAKFPEIIFGPISDEEKEYELWDLKMAVKTHSAAYVLKNLRQQIERIGKVMKKDWIAELEAQAENEKEEWEATKEASSEAPKTSNTFNDSAVPFQETPAPSSRVPESSGTQVPCYKCGAMNDSNAVKCGSCQIVLLEPCSVCNKMVKADATSCPFCKTEFELAK